MFDLEDLIVCVLFALLPALLFAIPKTRRMTGSWVTAWKTVPLGCITMLLLPLLILMPVELIRRLFDLFPKKYLYHTAVLFGLIFISSIIGLLVIFALSVWIWKKYHVEEDRSIFPIWVLLVGYIVVYFPLSLFLTFFHYSLCRDHYRSEWREFELPKEGNVQVIFEECSISPFQAEYDYRIRFKKDGKCEYRNLQTNTGGRTFFNIYRLKDGRFYFVDKASRYIVDPAKGEVLHVYEENQPASELEGKVYYGCITDDFYSAKEKKEQFLSEWRKATR